jgi:hypothetical protein
MNNLMMIVKLIPLLIQIIKAVENAIPGQGKGEAKLAMVRQLLEVADSSLNSIWPMVERVVGILVATFNKTNAWPKD